MKIMKYVLTNCITIISLIFLAGSEIISLITCASLVGVILSVWFVIVPLAFLYSPSLMRSFIFVPDKEIPDNLDYEHPESFGFIGGRNFYLTTPDGAILGVWHILPSNLESEARNLNLTGTTNAQSTQIYNDWLADATVFLYLHGSAGTRTSTHRLRLYKLLNKLNYHVIAFDYRGYGDSSGYPMNESNLVEDARTVFAWIKEKLTSGKIYLWGHSLGTGVGAHTADVLVGQGEQIAGIVLESPFNNMADAVRSSSFAKGVSFLPWFEHCFIEPLYENDLSFQSDKHLSNISNPVLVLHARDDTIIPYRLGAKLYETVATSRSDPTSVHLVSYDASLGYGHYGITLDPNLNNTVSLFVDKSSQ